jgi:hypothetical protein
MNRLVFSPGVLRMLDVRMDAAHGTPTIWEKLGALFGAGGANQAATLAGDQRDLTQAEQDVLTLFQPVLHTIEATGLSDLSTFLSTVLGGAASVTSVAGAVSLVKSAIANEGGTIASQAAALGETSLTTLVSAALASLGKVDLPAA